MAEGTLQAPGGTTPADLLAVADALSDFSDTLDDYIKAQPDPFTPEVQQLRSMDTHIAACAAATASVAVSDLAADVPGALRSLQAQIDTAKNTIKDIGDVRTGLSIVAAILSVAASISTGNPLGAAGSVLALAGTVESALRASGQAP